MRKIASDFMISGGVVCEKPLVEVDSQGVVVSVKCGVEGARDMEGVEFYEGLLIPGMVNSHSHLEYSYVKGKIERGSGLPHFIRSIINIKMTDPTTDEQKMAASKITDREMFEEGIVAVADHNNNDYVYDIKRESGVYYHSLVELFDMDGMSADEAFHWGVDRANQHKAYGLQATVIPHATYTMSDRLLGLCGGTLTSEKGEKATGVLSVHFKESVAMAGEEESDRIFAALSGERDAVMLVHSVYATREDIRRAKALAGDKLTVVICPLSNVFIEKGVADVEMLREEGVRIAMGTDSLSSNDLISMVAEMRAISESYPALKLEEIVGWATENGAKTLGIDNWAGTIEVGKKPGIVHVSNVDTNNMRLTADSRGKRLA